MIIQTQTKQPNLRSEVESKELNVYTCRPTVPYTVLRVGDLVLPLVQTVTTELLCQNIRINPKTKQNQ